MIYSTHFLTSELDGCEWSTLRPDRFTLGKETRYPLNRWLGGPQSRSGPFGEEQKLLPLLGLEFRNVHSLAAMQLIVFMQLCG